MSEIYEPLDLVYRADIATLIKCAGVRCRSVVSNEALSVVPNDGSDCRVTIPDP